MSIISTDLDYTDKDFSSLRTRLFNLLAGSFPTWTARQVANFGNILVELYCFVGDVLGKYQDNQAGESRWSTATQRKNLLALAKLIGFESPSATASQVDLTISVGSVQVTDITIPAETICRTSSIVNRVEFQTLTDATIVAGDTSVTVTGENSVNQEDVFTSPETPNYEIVLGSTPYIDDSIIITAANGAYDEVDTFLESTSTDRHFTVIVDQNDKATVRFGDGVNGAVPRGTVTVSYKTGGGSIGMVESGAVSVIEGTFQTDGGITVQLFVTNVDASTEATDRYTVEQIRQLAPLTLRVLNRTVTREDFEINALRVTGVARALMLTSDDDESISENRGILYVVPTGGGTPTTALLDAVEAMVTETYPHTLTFQVSVQEPSYFTVDVRAVITLSAGYAAATVKASIVSNLTEFFSPVNDDGTINESIGFGYDYIDEEGDATAALPWSDIHNVVRDTVGVKRIDPSATGFTLNEERDNISLAPREFPQLGTVTVVNAATGTEIP